MSMQCWIPCVDLLRRSGVLIVTLCWQWWNSRNKVWEGELAPGISEVVHRVRCSALEYEQTFAPKQDVVKAGKWHPPYGNELKVNLDGVFIPGSNLCGWGVVIRDSSGQIIAARAGHQEQVQVALGA